MAEASAAGAARRRKRAAAARPVAPPLVLAEQLDLAAAAALREALLARRGGECVLDGSGVRRLGGLCLQVLLSARELWAADGQVLRFAAVSAPFAEAAAGMAAAALLGLPAAAETVS